VSADITIDEREAIKQYADWYSSQGYEVSVDPAPRDLPEFLRTLAPDLIARRDSENVVVEIKTSSPASFEQVQRLARALEHRPGWKLRVVYADLPDPEWQPPPELPNRADLSARLAAVGAANGNDDQSRVRFVLLWSIAEAAARHRLASLGIPPTRRISSSALMKTLLTEGIIEDERYAVLRRALAVRNAIAHGFLNQSIDPTLVEAVRTTADDLLGSHTMPPSASTRASSRPRSPPSAA
jgi:hypothetical protein